MRIAVRCQIALCSVSVLASLASATTAAADTPSAAQEEVLGMFSGKAERPFSPTGLKVVAKPVEHPRSYRLRTTPSGERMLDIAMGNEDWKTRQFRTARVTGESSTPDGTRVIDYELPPTKTPAGRFNLAEYKARATVTGYKIASVTGGGRLVVGQDEVRDNHTEKVLLVRKFRPWVRTSFTDRTVYSGAKQAARK